MQDNKLMPISCGMRDGIHCQNVDKCIYKTDDYKCRPALNQESLTKNDIINRFHEYNREHGIQYGCATDVPKITAVIVYKQSNFTKPYTEEQRSYRVSNLSGKIFFDGMCGMSMWGDCLDGQDLRVRLDYYNWEVERCYFE